MMLKQNIIFLVIKSICIDTIKDIIRFPLWWYSKGFIRVVYIIKDNIIWGEEALAIRIWIKNLFRPMYGQYDWTGKIISFFMRLVQIIIRSILLLIWVLICLFLLIMNTFADFSNV